MQLLQEMLDRFSDDEKEKWLPLCNLLMNVLHFMDVDNGGRGFICREIADEKFLAKIGKIAKMHTDSEAQYNAVAKFVKKQCRDKHYSLE